VRDAKTHFGAACQACTFTYPARYRELGEGYIEIHHLNPLSEQGSASSDPKLSKLSQVTALCANCHRMIHRLIRKERRAVTLEEFRKYLA
jgi:5-methylcytosine-specific restriction protein A